MPLLTNGINAFKIVNDEQRINNLLKEGWTIVPEVDSPVSQKKDTRQTGKRVKVVDALPEDAAAEPGTLYVDREGAAKGRK